MLDTNVRTIQKDVHVTISSESFGIQIELKIECGWLTQTITVGKREWYDEIEEATQIKFDDIFIANEYIKWANDEGVASLIIDLDAQT